MHGEALSSLDGSGRQVRPLASQDQHAEVAVSLFRPTGGHPCATTSTTSRSLPVWTECAPVTSRFRRPGSSVSSAGCLRAQVLWAVCCGATRSEEDVTTPICGASSDVAYFRSPGAATVVQRACSLPCLLARAKGGLGCLTSARSSASSSVRRSPTLPSSARCCSVLFFPACGRYARLRAVASSLSISVGASVKRPEMRAHAGHLSRGDCPLPTSLAGLQLPYPAR